MNSFLYIDLGLFVITTGGIAIAGGVAIAYLWFSEPIDKM